MSNSEIAAALVLGDTTIKTDRKSVV